MGDIQSSLKGYLSFVSRSAFFSAKGLLVRKIKYGRAFRQALQELEHNQWLDAEKLRRHQNAKLQRLIQHAAIHVPYYREQFRKLGLEPEDIQNADDLKQLPILDKTTLRERHAEFVAATINPRLLSPGWTTGSTGTPINALRTPQSIAIESAAIWRQRRWAGVSHNDRKAAVWGTIWDNVIMPASLNTGPYWRYNWAEKQLLLSYYHMSDDTLPQYFDKLAEFRPSFIEGFPSTMVTLARFLRRHNRFFPVKAIFTSSEPLYTTHRAEIEERFQTKVYDHYGQAERVAAAFECPQHNGLHVDPDYGILEVIQDNRDVAPGETGEIIGTGLNNLAMPLIRYKTGDLATLARNPCTCGRHTPVIETIEGRLADLIVTPDGRTIPGNGIMGAFHDLENVSRTQVVQEQRTTLDVYLEVEEPQLPVNVERLRSNLQACLGNSLEIRIHTVDRISANGRKFRWMVSKLPHD